MKINLNKALQFQLMKDTMNVENLKWSMHFGEDPITNTRLIMRNINVETHPSCLESPESLYEHLVNVLALRKFQDLPYLIYSYLSKHHPQIQSNKLNVIFSEIDYPAFFIIPIEVNRKGIKRKGLTYRARKLIPEELPYPAKQELRDLIESYLRRRSIVKGSPYMEKLHENICTLQKLFVEEAKVRYTIQLVSQDIILGVIDENEGKVDYDKMMEKRMKIVKQIEAILNEETIEE